MNTLYSEDLHIASQVTHDADQALDITNNDSTDGFEQVSRRVIPLGFWMLIIALVSGIGVIEIKAWSPYPINESFEKREFTDSLNRKMPYRLLEPKQIKNGENYPLVIFLHGAGERGDDNEKQLTYGAGMFTNPANVDKYPAYVLFPQTRERSWVNIKGEQTFMPGAETLPESQSEEVVMELIDDVISHNAIDKNRIYIVGMSMGGIATYDLVCRYPEKFTAAIPICGAVNPERLTAAKDVKFMIFHGENDEEVPLICGREAYKALNTAGAQVEYIEFAGVGHECWDDAFNYPNFLPWLFSQTKNYTTDNLAEENSNL